jgi:hypothetical protein
VGPAALEGGVSELPGPANHSYPTTDTPNKKRYYLSLVDGQHLRYGYSFHYRLLVVCGAPVAQRRMQPASVVETELETIWWTPERVGADRQ